MAAHFGYDFWGRIFPGRGRENPPPKIAAGMCRHPNRQRNRLVGATLFFLSGFKGAFGEEGAFALHEAAAGHNHVDVALFAYEE